MSKGEQRVRKTVVVMRNKERYRLFAEDLKKILKVNKIKLPPIPKYKDNS